VYRHVSADVARATLLARYGREAVGSALLAAYRAAPRPPWPFVPGRGNMLIIATNPSSYARVRDLTTWNDRSYRTREDVLRLIDLATARVAGGHGQEKLTVVEGP